MERCPYPERKLPLLRAACVRAAAHTIAVVISDTLGLMMRQRLAWLSIGCRNDLVFEVALLINPK